MTIISKKDILLSKTKQMWKFYLFNLSLILAGILFYIGIYSIKDIEIGIGLIFIALFLGGFGFIFSTASIRCPNCRLRWMYWAMKTKKLSGWLPWLLNAKKCPNCNYTV